MVILPSAIPPPEHKPRHARHRSVRVRQSATRQRCIKMCYNPAALSSISSPANHPVIHSRLLHKGSDERIHPRILKDPIRLDSHPIFPVVVRSLRHRDKTRRITPSGSAALYAVVEYRSRLKNVWQSTGVPRNPLSDAPNFFTSAASRAAASALARIRQATQTPATVHKLSRVRRKVYHSRHVIPSESSLDLFLQPPHTPQRPLFPKRGLSSPNSSVGPTRNKQFESSPCQ